MVNFLRRGIPSPRLAVLAFIPLPPSGFCRCPLPEPRTVEARRAALLDHLPRSLCLHIRCGSRCCFRCAWCRVSLRAHTLRPPCCSYRAMLFLANRTDLGMKKAQPRRTAPNAKKGAATLAAAPLFSSDPLHPTGGTEFAICFHRDISPVCLEIEVVS